MYNIFNGNPYIISGVTLFLREIVAGAVSLYKTRSERRASDLEAATRAKELDVEHAAMVFRQFVEHIESLKRDVADIREELGQERSKRRAAEEEVRVLRDEISDLRRALRDAGCPALSCIADGRCSRPPGASGSSE